MKQPRNTRMSKLPLFGAAVIAAALLAVMGINSCAGGSGQPPAPVVQPPYFTWENFLQAEGRYTYIAENATASKTGIDVSDHQGWIDWSAVRADGVEFAFIRAGYRGSTEGSIYQDDYFAYNFAATKEAGLQRGVYFYSQATTTQEAVEEADFVLGLLGGESLDYPIVFDMEINASNTAQRVDNLTSDQATAAALAFCEHIEAAGYDAMVYGNSNDIAHYNMEELEAYPFWYAEYGALPSCPYPYRIWQYTYTGQVSGIDTIVDLNLDLSAAVQP